jgi:hypothetical protein
MNEHSDVIGDERGVAGPGPGSRQRWRTILAILLIVVAACWPRWLGWRYGPADD